MTPIRILWLLLWVPGTILPRRHSGSCLAANERDVRR